MLVLSRKPDEKVCVGANITIKVIKVRGNVVQLGIEAPANVRILRGELPNWFELPKKHARSKARVALAG